MTTVLAYTSPAAGHLFPLVPGLLELRRRGHEVHVRTAAELLPAVRAAGLDAAAVDPRIEAIEVSDHRARSGADRLKKGFEDILRRGRLDGPDLEAAVAATGADVLLVDTLAYGAGVAAECSGLPWAISLPSLLPLRGRGIPPYGLGLALRADLLGRVRDELGWRLVERLYGRVLLPRLNELRAAAGLAPLNGVMELFDAPDRVLALTGDPLEYRRDDLPPHVRLVGAQPWDPAAVARDGRDGAGDPSAAAPPTWLDEPGDPWVLVTCSTEYQGDERLAATAIEALRDEPLRVLVTLADAAGGEAAAALPRAPNVRIERFVPHGPVLERAAAVVCHGGMGIVQKTVAAGVPLVAVPFGRDQPEVARRVAECGAGVRLPHRKLTPPALRTAVHTAMARRERAAETARRLRASGGPARFADEVEQLAATRALLAAAATA